MTQRWTQAQMKDAAADERGWVGIGRFRAAPPAEGADRNRNLLSTFLRGRGMSSGTVEAGATLMGE